MTSVGDVDIRGPEMFARYAYAPNQLGYCGPPDLDALTGGSVERIRTAARRFSGAWPYLRVLSALTGISDPLDYRLVESYWLGGGVGAALDADEFYAALLAVIGPQAGHYWSHLDDELAARPPEITASTYSGCIRGPDSWAAAWTNTRCTCSIVAESPPPRCWPGTVITRRCVVSGWNGMARHCNCPCRQRKPLRCASRGTARYPMCNRENRWRCTGAECAADWTQPTCAISTTVRTDSSRSPTAGLRWSPDETPNRQDDEQIGFYWTTVTGGPTSLQALVETDDEPDRLIATHLAALDDALIIAAERFAEILGGGGARPMPKSALHCWICIAPWTGCVSNSPPRCSVAGR